MKKLEFFQRQLDERNPQIFRAAIVDVRNYGLMVELPDALITGLVHVSSLTDDFYLFEPARRQLIARRSRRAEIVTPDQIFSRTGMHRSVAQNCFALSDGTDHNSPFENKSP